MHASEIGPNHGYTRALPRPSYSNNFSNFSSFRSLSFGSDWNTITVQCASTWIVLGTHENCNFAVRNLWHWQLNKTLGQIPHSMYIYSTCTKWKGAVIHSISRHSFIFTSEGGVMVTWRYDILTVEEVEEYSYCNKCKSTH